MKAARSVAILAALVTALGLTLASSTVARDPAEANSGGSTPKSAVGDIGDERSFAKLERVRAIMEAKHTLLHFNFILKNIPEDAVLVNMGTVTDPAGNVQATYEQENTVGELEEGVELGDGLRMRTQVLPIVGRVSVPAKAMGKFEAGKGLKSSVDYNRAVTELE